MNTKKAIWRITAIIAAVLAVLFLVSCNGNLEKLEFSSPLTEDERIYYTGQSFDIEVSTEHGKFPKKPQVFVVYKDGTRSEDVSDSDKVTFSGYDPDTPGEQTITVSYRDGSYKLKATYKITVIERTLLYIEADDTYHCLHPYKVGDEFKIAEEADGTKRGVTVTFRYNDPENPTEAFFGDDPALGEIEFDTAGCFLNEDGRFTKAGTFTVHVSYKGMTATYKISVAERESE